MTSIHSVQQLIPGSTSYSTPPGFLNLRQAPIAARADVMKQGSGASIIVASADYTSFSTQGGSFDFDAAIPSDSTIYLILMEFFLP